MEMEEAVAAMTGINEQEFMGRALHVRQAVPARKRTPAVGKHSQRRRK